MLLWLEVKYADLLGSALERFKVKKRSPYLATFRCFICGDSKTNKFKTRGYLYTSKKGLMFKCQNCGASHRFPTILKMLDQALFNQYTFESIAASGRTEESPGEKEPGLTVAKPKFITTGILSSLKTISQLEMDHPARKYVIGRKIPASSHFRLFYAPKFKQFVNSLIPDKLPDTMMEEPRLIIPFIDDHGKVYGFQGRSFRKDAGKLRYISIMLENDKPKLFGLERVDLDTKYYVTEGPIDSLFLPNAIAMAGSDTSVKFNSNVVFVYDNEPRNKEIVDKMVRVVENGYNIVVWPNHIEEKDINDMVLSGKTAEQVQTIIDENTFSGLTALIQISQWRKDL